jgi:hypothetical protein
VNYATYSQYVQEYGGSLISENDFKKMILKASRYIDYFTDNKITQDNLNKYPELVMCSCEIADAICNHSDANGKVKEKKSENTDGYSVTYVTESVDGSLVDSMLKRKAYEIARVHLMNTGLLYLGID